MTAPCPFCGERNAGIKRVGTWFMQCFTCGTEGPNRDAQDEAIGAWNCRPLETEARESLAHQAAVAAEYDNARRELWQQAEAARAALARLREAARHRVSRGHNDTCQLMVAGVEPCSCGHDQLGEALEAIE